MALSMEGSIRQVELLFQKAVAELDEVQHALENEFAEKFPKNVCCCLLVACSLCALDLGVMRTRKGEKGERERKG